MDYKAAKKRVKELKEFYVHLAIYLSVITMLFVIDFIDKGNWWFYWPMIGWGIGILIHSVSVFFETGVLGKEWEEKKIREIMEHSH